MYIMIECEFLQNESCTLAEKLIQRYGVNRKIFVKEDACSACLRSQCPKTINHVIISHVFKVYMGFGGPKWLQFEMECINEIKKGNKCIEIEEEIDLSEGPGTELHLILKKEGFKLLLGCSCISVIKEMNLNGVDWCLENIQYISDSMIKEARRRGIRLPDEMLIFQSKEWIIQACQQYSNNLVK